MHQNIGTYCLPVYLSTYKDYAVLCDVQHGFCPNENCHTQLIITVNDVAECSNKGGQCDVLDLDFIKAFD